VTRRGTDGFFDDLALMRGYFAHRSPIYARAVELLAELLRDPELAARLDQAWRERSFPAFFDRPLLLLAVLRARVLAAGPAHPLGPALGDDAPQVDALSGAALAAELSADALWTELARRHVQTNDPTRAVAWLWPAWLGGCDRGARPLALVDVGASAGLNLIADALPAAWRDGAGAPLPVARAVQTVARLGLDGAPLDVRQAEDRAWMRACIWPGEATRRQRFDAAVEVVLAGNVPVIERMDASSFTDRIRELQRVLAPGTLVLAYQTVFREYLEAMVRAAYLDGMADWIASAPKSCALWIELEVAPEPTREHPAALIAHVREGQTLVIGRCSFHPDVIDVDAQAAAALARALTARM